ncbi:MAG: imelysin family protein [Pseudomonadota bacterium]
MSLTALKANIGISMQTNRILAFTFGMLFSLTACVDGGAGGGSGGGGGDGGVPPAPTPAPVNPIATLEAALTQAVDVAILPAVVGFLDDAQRLDDNAEAFCSDPNLEGLRTLQANWRALFEQWYRLSLYNFGPLDDNIVFPAFTFIDSLRLRGTDYLETVRSEVSNDLTSTRELEDSYFANKTFQRVGLLALESVIFETSTPEHSTDTNQVLAEFTSQVRKCQILTGLAAQVLGQAIYVEQGWLTAFTGSELSYRTLFLDGQVDEDGTEPMSALLIAGQEYLDYVQARSVVLVAGQVSGHIWEAVSASIDEVELFLEGRADTSNSIFDVMAVSGNQNEIADVRDSIAQVRQALADRDPDMLEITLGFLDGNYKREIPDSLDVVLGINFSDGD